MGLPSENVVHEINREIKSITGACEKGCFQQAQKVMNTAKINTTPSSIFI